MKRCILHWTGGTYTPNATDKQHYHFLIDGDGKVLQAISVSRNMPPLAAGYAAHTLHCNSESIGIAVCCAAGATPTNLGKYPPTHAQLNELCYSVAILCYLYRIPVTPQTVLTHGEVQEHLGIRQRGKWDLNVLPGVEGSGGDYLRRIIARSLADIAGRK